MNMKVIAGLIFGMFLMGFVMPLTNLELNQISCSTFESGKENIVGVQIPEQIPYKNELFNIYIEGELFGYLEIQESNITDLGCSEREDETYDIYIEDIGTIKDIFQNETPEIVVQEKIQNKEINIKGTSIGKRIKWSFTKLFLKWFG